MAWEEQGEMAQVEGARPGPGCCSHTGSRLVDDRALCLPPSLQLTYITKYNQNCQVAYS